MKTKVMILCGLLLLLGFLLSTSWQNPVASAQGITEPAQYEWILQTRGYVAEDSGTWDAYLYNVRTGDVYFINQATKTLVKEGKAKGAGK